MDINITCRDIEVSSGYSNKIEVVCRDADTDFLDEADVLKRVSSSDYISILDDREKDDMLIELLDHVDINLVLMQYDKEQILENFDLDEILDYFKDNLINHV